MEEKHELSVPADKQEPLPPQPSPPTTPYQQAPPHLPSYPPYSYVPPGTYYPPPQNNYTNPWAPPYQQQIPSYSPPLVNPYVSQKDTYASVPPTYPPAAFPNYGAARHQPGERYDVDSSDSDDLPSRNWPDHNTPIFPAISEWRDIIFLFFFIGHLVIVGIIAGVKQSQYGEHDEDTERVPKNNSNSTFTHEEVREYYVDSLLIMAFCALLLAFSYLQLIKKQAIALIYVGLAVSVGTMGCLTFWAFSHGLALYGIFFLFITCFLPFYFYTMRGRIPFAVAMVKAAVRVIEAFPATQLTAFVAIFVHFCWSAFWLCTFGAVVSSRMDRNNILCVIYLIFSFYWVHEVITNVLHVSVCGVVGSWYFLTGTPQMPTSPTLGAIKRAVTTSLGSICLGSLFVAILRTIRAAINILSDYNEFTSCILDCLDSLISYFNHYAFCQVAIYGKTFFTAAIDTWSLLKKSGIEAVANDNILNGVFLLGSFLGAIVIGFLGYLLQLSWPATNGAGLFIAGCVLGFIVVSLVMQIVDSAVVCIFVCFATSPDALKGHDLDLWHRLRGTFHEEI